VGLPELHPSLRSEIRQRWLESAARMFVEKPRRWLTPRTSDGGFFVKEGWSNAQKREWRRVEGSRWECTGRWNGSARRE